jgi:hypothetical protein
VQQYGFQALGSPFFEFFEKFKFGPLENFKTKKALSE